MKKLFTLFLALAAGAGTLFAWDYKRVQIDGLYYNLDASTQTAEVTSQNSSSPYWSTVITTATIPASVNYNEITYSVTSIGIYAFRDCTGLTSVTIPNSVTSIGHRAFRDCTGLTLVTIPNSVTSIGSEAFADCSGLTSVTIGNSVTSIGSYVFSGCSGLTSVTIPNSVTSIGDWAFSNCSGLTSLTIPNSVTSIGERAFYQCSGLTSVTIGNSVTSIGSSAFSGCSNLTSVTIPNSVTSIGGSAFYKCTGLTSPVYNTHVFAYMPTSYSGAYTIPDGIESIVGGAFLSCTGLTSVTIPSSVTSIGGGAFQNCPSLTSIELPNSVTSIGQATFQYCTGLTSVTIPNSVTSIGDYAFGDCRGLTSVTIPNSVTSIGNGAFRYCSGLTSVTIPNSVTIIGNQAFMNCSSLTSVMIPNSVTSIGENAFLRCSGLTSLTIPNSVTSIGNGAFYDCSGLTSVHISDLAAWCAISFGNYSANPLSHAHNLYLNETLVTDLIIPNEVTSIGNSAFYGCSGLTSVTIPNSVTSIGNNAFFRVSNIVYSGDATGAPWGAKSINGYVENYLVFDNETKTTLLACSSSALGEINIPNSVTSIGNNAFRDCSGLTSVTIPNSVTSIGNDAFSYCSGLTSVHISDLAAWCAISFGNNNANPLYYAHNLYLNETLVTDLIIPNDVTSIGERAFWYCSSLTSVTIPNSVTSIGNYAFYQCSGLTSVTIPNSVTSIGNYAFYNCSGLTSVTIPNSVTSIGSSAFYNVANIVYYGEATGSPWGAKSINGYVEDFLVYNNETKTTLRACSSSAIGEIVIPNSVTSIGERAFYQCSGLTSVTIPNSVTSIGSSAFYLCTGLTSVTIPSSVTSIGGGAFYKCTGLTSVTNYATTPQTISSNVFNNVDKSTCKLYVPIEAVSAYQSTSVWQDFLIGGAAMTAKADPDNTSAYYTTFFDSSNKYRLSAGMEAYTAVINGDVLNLTKVAAGGEVIPANEAFILKSNAANLTMDVTDDDPVAVGANVLRGVDTATPSPANCYVLSGKSSDNSVQGLGFYQFSGTLGAHKAYLVLGGGASGAPRRLRFSFNETNTATGVEEVQTNQVQPTKVIENGQVVIMYKGTKYNVQGARVE